MREVGDEGGTGVWRGRKGGMKEEVVSKECMCCGGVKEGSMRAYLIVNGVKLGEDDTIDGA